MTPEAMQGIQEQPRPGEMPGQEMQPEAMKQMQPERLKETVKQKKTTMEIPGADEAGEGDAVGGDAVVPVQDEAVPQALQDLDEVEDPEVPLANVNNELSSKRMGYFPIYGGIAATAAAALIIMAFVLKKRQKSRSVAVRLLHNLKDKEK